MGREYELPCGCKFPVLAERDGDVPLLDFRVQRAPMSCPAVWNMLAVGLTKGVFQLESGLGRKWTKRLKPESVEQLSALTAVLRPGCLNATAEDGESMTEHYCRRKNNEEPTPAVHPAVDPALADTFGICVYQESALRLVKDTAGFNLQEADQLRRAAGKKSAEEMAKVKSQYLEKVKEFGVIPYELGVEIIGIIEASQRYAFNRSHSRGYGGTAYDCAYGKAHFPAVFIGAWIKGAHDKPKPSEERAELITEAKAMGVQVTTPDFRKLDLVTAVDRGMVRLGWADVRGMGPGTVRKMEEGVREVTAQLGRGPADWAWGEVVSRLFPLVPATALTLLAQAGAFAPYGLSRRRCAYEIQQLQSLKLTEPELTWVAAQPPFASAAELCQKLGRVRREGGGCATVNRARKVQAAAAALADPPYSLEDTPLHVLNFESELFGCGVSLTRVETCNADDVNCTCREFLAGRDGLCILGVEVKGLRTAKTKRGKTPGAEMAHMTLGDSSADISDVPLFPENWARWKDLLTTTKAVYVAARQDKKKKVPLMVDNIWAMRPL
jgi:DNA polymerase III alpha subunit